MTRASFSKTFDQYRNAVRGGQRTLPLIDAARRDLSPSEYGPLMRLLMSDRRARQTLIRHAHMREAAQTTWGVLGDIGAERELRWVAAYLETFHSDIEFFVDRATAFANVMLHDNVNDLEDTLNVVERRVGDSAWLVTNAIAALQRFGGLKTQKSYAASKMTDVTPPMLRAIAHYASFRNEASVTPTRYKIEVARFLSGGLSPDAAAFLAFYLSDPSDLTSSALIRVLRTHLTGPIIDCYEAFVRVSQILVARGESAVPLRQSLDTLMVADERLTLLRHHLGGDEKRFDPATVSSPGVTAFLEGRYDDAHRAATAALDVDALDSDALEIAALAATMVPGRMERAEKPLLSEIIARLSAVIAREPSGDDDALALEKIVQNIDLRHLNATITWLLRRDNSSATDWRTDPVGALAGASIARPTTRRSGLIPPSYIQALTPLDGSTLRANYITFLAGYGPAPTPVCGSELQLLEGMTALREGRFADGAGVANSLFSSADDIYYRNAAARLLASALLRQGDTVGAAGVIVNLYLSAERTYRLMPMEEVLVAIQTNGLATLAAHIAVPLLYDIYSRRIARTFETNRNYAYEDFLLSHGVTKPSELLVQAQHFDRAQLIYFLRFVCVENVMDTSIVFSRSREVAEERVAICRYLADVDPDHAEIHQSEIRDVLRRLTVTRRVQQIEESKFHIDTVGLRDAVTRRIQESFNRYVALRAAQLDEATFETLRVALERTLGANIQLFLPVTELHRLADQIITDARDEFAGGEFGLDGYLSVRIRHGTLEGQLRSPLEAQDLITRSDVASGTYRSNDTWLARLQPDPEDVEALGAAFTSFSAEFDKLLQEILRTWMQVRRRDDQPGYFDLRLIPEVLLSLRRIVGRAMAIDDFTTQLLANFSLRVEDGLHGVRRALSTEGKERANALLGRLQASVNALIPKSRAGHFNYIVNNTRTELQRVFDRVSDWFRPPNTSSHDPFTFDEVIISCIEAVRAFDSRFDAQVSEGGKVPLTLRGDLLPNFFDIFFILFENIIRHARRPDGPAAEVSLNYDLPTLRLRVVNRLAEAPTKDARQRVNLLRTALHEPGGISNIAREGGTGFLKIWKILRYDLHLPAATIGFDFIGDDSFYFECAIDSAPLVTSTGG